MQNWIESQSTKRFTRVEDEPATTEFVRPALDRDDTVPAVLYSSPYERVEVEVERTPASMTAATNLVASERVRDRPSVRARPRRRGLDVSPWAMLAAALVGASVFVLGVVVASTL